MMENTNRAIAYNSIILYGKMVINTVCALLTTRFALQALGVVDFGLYAVLGGIISLISIFNTIMLATSNRFIALAIGKGNLVEINKQFNVNLIVHFAIAVLALIVAFPVGEWYIPRYVNYDGPLSSAMMVYVVSITASIFSFVGVPYNGLLLAKEKFIVFSGVDVFCHIVKMVVAWWLIGHFEEKLFIYTMTIALLTVLPVIVYIIYCSWHYREIVRIRLVRDKGMYTNVFKFSAWVSVGAVASVGRTQGAALVVNAFFNTVMNTAMGVASSINAYITMFAQNVTQPMAPQITKSYAVGNSQRTEELLIMSTKYSFLLMLLISSVFLAAPKWILGLWLGEVPPYASIFLILFIIDNLVQSVNSGVSNLIFASGKIGAYQIVVSSLNVLSVVLGYFILKRGAPAYALLIAYIVVSCVKFFCIQLVLHRSMNFKNILLWKKSYLPSLCVAMCFLPMCFFPSSIHPCFRVICALLFLFIIEYWIGLSKEERQMLKRFVDRIIKK